MNNEYVIITDIVADLGKQYAEAEKIDIIPLYYRFEGEQTVYGGENEISQEAFYEKLSKNIRPYTMGANIQFVEDIFRKRLEEGKDILCIILSTNVSGTYNAAYTVANELRQEYKERKINLVDSLSASLTEGLLVKEAVNLKNEGKSIDQVTKYVEENKRKYAARFLVADLKYLVLGGRLNKISGRIGNMLNLKPVLKLTEDGNIEMVFKTRGHKQAITAMLKSVKETLSSEDHIAVLHAGNEQLAMLVKERIENELNLKVEIVSSITLILGSHMGKDAVGIVYIGKR
ncbi:MAG: DegV family protein [Clostridia bacterium]